MRNSSTEPPMPRVIEDCGGRTPRQQILLEKPLDCIPSAAAAGPESRREDGLVSDNRREPSECSLERGDIELRWGTPPPPRGRSSTTMRQTESRGGALGSRKGGSLAKGSVEGGSVEGGSVEGGSVESPSFKGGPVEGARGGAAP